MSGLAGVVWPGFDGALGWLSCWASAAEARPAMAKVERTRRRVRFI
jgi:hypothetical protein